MRHNGFTFFFGAASGSSKKALRRLEESDVMINYATHNNYPWSSIDNLFIDSGGYSFMLGKGEYTTTNDEYLEYIDEHNPDKWALRDYPCEPEVLREHNRSVLDHQQMTIDRHRDLLNLYDDRSGICEPYTVLQGWDTDDYINHIDSHIDAGTLTDNVAIGSVCRRNRENEIAEIITTVADSLPNRVKTLHAFGVKGSVLTHTRVQQCLSSADSLSYDFNSQWGDGTTGKTWTDKAFHYLKHRRRLNRIMQSNNQSETEQTTLADQT
jgi:hypothetical protein